MQLDIIKIRCAAAFGIRIYLEAEAGNVCILRKGVREIERSRDLDPPTEISKVLVCAFKMREISFQLSRSKLPTESMRFRTTLLTFGFSNRR